jgi:hypothetical protein
MYVRTCVYVIMCIHTYTHTCQPNVRPLFGPWCSNSFFIFFYFVSMFFFTSSSLMCDGPLSVCACRFRMFFYFLFYFCAFWYYQCHPHVRRDCSSEPGVLAFFFSGECSLIFCIFYLFITSCSLMCDVTALRSLAL